MIKIENYEVVGWEAAIRGMRNPMNSWDKSDSEFNRDPDYGCSGTCPCEDMGVNCDQCFVGPNDHDLMMRLNKAGSDHRKYIRYLEVYVDITAPLYWWKQFKTYRHGRKFQDDDDIFEYDDDILEYHIETNSCSTMHRIHEKEFTLDDFSHEHLMTAHADSLPIEIHAGRVTSPLGILQDTIFILNKCRDKFLETKDKKYWWQMIQLLPNSYNQKRTVKLSYECLARMYHSRKNHKQDEWREFCEWIETLPYSEIITGEREESK